MTRRGFTLIELSIVLVVIGLLAGGIMLGVSLVRNTKLYAVRMEAEQYTGALKQFRERFQFLPGDFPGATATWGAASSCPGSTNLGSTTATCNGDGNGRVGLYNTSLTEGFHAWKHLENAKLGPASATGPSTVTTAGWSLPVSRLKEGGFLLLYIGDLSGNAALFDGEYGNAFFFGQITASPPTPYVPTGPVLTTQEAERIDRKYDDGFPALGGIRSYIKGAALGEGLCTTSTSASAGTAALYDLTQPSNSRRCGLVFLTGF